MMNLTKTALYISCALTATAFANTEANLAFSANSNAQAEYQAEQTQFTTSSNMQNNASASSEQNIETDANQSAQTDNDVAASNNSDVGTSAEPEDKLAGNSAVSNESTTEAKSETSSETSSEATSVENSDTAKADSEGDANGEASMSVDSILLAETLTKSGQQLQAKVGENHTMLQETFVSSTSSVISGIDSVVKSDLTFGQNVSATSSETFDLALTASEQQAMAVGDNLSSTIEQNTSVIVEQAIDNTVNANLAAELLSSTAALTDAEVSNALIQTLDATINATTEQSVTNSISQNVEQSVTQNVTEQIDNAVTLTVDNSVENAINASTSLGI